MIELLATECIFLDSHYAILPVSILRGGVLDDQLQPEIDYFGLMRLFWNVLTLI
jgi:hypothetical protein